MSESSYKIVLNIDGIENLYVNNELIKLENLKPLKVEGGKTDLNKNPFKFCRYKTNNNCNICYVINCYIKDDELYHLNDIHYEIINIMQQYIETTNENIKDIIEKLLSDIVKYCKNIEKESIINLPYNIEILYTKHNGGIYNNRNKFIYNINKICEYDYKTNNYKFPYVLMLDDSDFQGFDSESKILKYLDKNFDDNNIWSIGTISNKNGPGHISFWERIYKTKFLNNFINLPGDICDDGKNKEYSKDNFETIYGHCLDLNEKWCDYGNNSKTKTTVHLNPPPIFIYDNKLNSFNNINPINEHYTSKVFNYDNENELSILNYILQYYFILAIKTRAEDKLTLRIKINNMKTLPEIRKFIENEPGNKILKLEGYFVNLNPRMGCYKYIIENLKKIGVLNENNSINQEYKFYAYPKHLFTKINEKSPRHGILIFKSLDLLNSTDKNFRDDVYYINETVYYVKSDQIPEELPTVYILRKYKNNAELSKNKFHIVKNPVFKTLGGTIDIIDLLKKYFKLIILIIIIIIIIILYINNNRFFKNNQ